MKLKLFYPILALFFVLSIYVNAQKSTIVLDELPIASQSFIKTHFPKEKVTHIIKDKELLSVEYEVHLSDGKKLEFDGDGDWKEIKAKKSTTFNESFIPEKIRTYVSANYPQSGIYKIEKNPFKYEVKLSNGLELEFDENGKFIRIDD